MTSLRAKDAAELRALARPHGCEGARGWRSDDAIVLTDEVPPPPGAHPSWKGRPALLGYFSWRAGWSTFHRVPYRQHQQPQYTVRLRTCGKTVLNLYAILVGTLRDWEQGRAEPDHAAQACLNPIARDQITAGRLEHEVEPTSTTKQSPGLSGGSTSVPQSSALTSRRDYGISPKPRECRFSRWVAMFGHRELLQCHPERRLPERRIYAKRLVSARPASENRSA